MTTLLFTAHDAAYAPLAEITVPRMQAYAKRHGYEFICYTEPLADIPHAIYWSGVLGAAPNLEKFDRVMYLDVDQLITNPALSIEDLVNGSATGFHASRDWGNDANEPWHFSMCGWVAHRNCVSLFHEAFDMEPEWRDRDFPEQGPFQDVVRRKMEGLVMVDNSSEAAQYNGLINIHPRRTFNAVPDEVAPGKVPEPWQPGDFAAHITMLRIEDRVHLAKELYEKTKSMG